ncbi:hypothetical protein [Micromonospora sp. NPDC001898]|uniref:hypothetical protein n=1 Tax=Micromonospora sp. NPDC001898 TaxID=3364221 RepID=UPI00367ED222
MNVTSSRGVVTANLAGLPADEGLRVFADVLSQLSADIATDNSFSSATLPGHPPVDHTCSTRLHLPDD